MDISLYHEASRERETARRPSAVLFHGITGTPDEMFPLGKLLFENGFDIFIPSLAGHEKTIDALRPIRASAWQTDIERSYEEIASRNPAQIFVVGLSFGALLALTLTATKKEHISGLVLLSTPYLLRSRKREIFLRIFSYFTDFLLDRLGIVAKSVRDPALFTGERKGYSSHSVGALARAKYLQRLLSTKLSLIECPVLLMQDPEDHHVRENSLPKLKEQLVRADIDTAIVSRERSNAS
jgi:esterase/lipase